MKEFRHVTASANPVDVESLLESRYKRLFSEVRVKSTFSRDLWERIRRRGGQGTKTADREISNSVFTSNWPSILSYGANSPFL